MLTVFNLKSGFIELQHVFIHLTCCSAVWELVHKDN